MAGMMETCFADGICVQFPSKISLLFGVKPTRNYILLDDDGSSVRIVPVYSADFHCVNPGFSVRMFNEVQSNAVEKDFVPLLGEASEIFGFRFDRTWRSANCHDDTHYGGYGYAALYKSNMLISKDILQGLDFNVFPKLCPERVLYLIRHHDIYQLDLEKKWKNRPLPRVAEMKLQDVDTYEFDDMQ